MLVSLCLRCALALHAISNWIIMCVILCGFEKNVSFKSGKEILHSFSGVLYSKRLWLWCQVRIIIRFTIFQQIFKGNPFVGSEIELFCQFHKKKHHHSQSFCRDPRSSHSIYGSCHATKKRTMYTIDWINVSIYEMSSNRQCIIIASSTMFRTYDKCERRWRWRRFNVT